MRGAWWQRGFDLLIGLQVSGYAEPICTWMGSISGVNQVSLDHACALLLVGEYNLFACLLMAQDGGDFFLMGELGDAMRVIRRVGGVHLGEHLCQALIELLGLFWHGFHQVILFLNIHPDRRAIFRIVKAVKL